MKFSPALTPVHQSHKQLISPAQFWRTAKISYFFLYFFQHDIENITLNANCSLEIRVAEDAYVFVSYSCFLSIIYDLRKRSVEVRMFPGDVSGDILAAGLVAGHKTNPVGLRRGEGIDFGPPLQSRHDLSPCLNS